MIRLYAQNNNCIAQGEWLLLELDEETLSGTLHDKSDETKAIITFAPDNTTIRFKHDKKTVNTVMVEKSSTSTLLIGLTDSAGLVLSQVKSCLGLYPTAVNRKLLGSFLVPSMDDKLLSNPRSRIEFAKAAELGEESDLLDKILYDGLYVKMHEKYYQVSLRQLNRLSFKTILEIRSKGLDPYSLSVNDLSPLSMVEGLLFSSEELKHLMRQLLILGCCRENGRVLELDGKKMFSRVLLGKLLEGSVDDMAKLLKIAKEEIQSVMPPELLSSDNKPSSLRASPGNLGCRWLEENDHLYSDELFTASGGYFEFRDFLGYLDNSNGDWRISPYWQTVRNYN